GDWVVCGGGERVGGVVEGWARFRPNRPDVRPRHAVRLRLFQPPGRRLPRGLARRCSVRTHWLLRYRMVALGMLRDCLRRDQSADRGTAGAAAGGFQGTGDFELVYVNDSLTN